MNFKNIIKNNAPDILLGVSFAGWTATTILSSKDARVFDEKKRKLEELVGRPLTRKELAAVFGKSYWRTMTAAGISTATMAASAVMSHKKTAAIGAAFSAVTASYNAYKGKVEKLVKEGKDVLIETNEASENSEAKSRLNKSNTGSVYVRVRDEFGREFLSDENKIKYAVEKINNMMLTSCDNAASLNDFYREVDIDETSYGDTVGWNISDGRIKPEFEAIYENGEFILKYSFNIVPRSGFNF